MYLWINHYPAQAGQVVSPVKTQLRHGNLRSRLTRSHCQQSGRLLAGGIQQCVEKALLSGQSIPGTVLPIAPAPAEKKTSFSALPYLAVQKSVALSRLFDGKKGGAMVVKVLPRPIFATIVSLNEQ